MKPFRNALLDIEMKNVNRHAVNHLKSKHFLDLTVKSHPQTIFDSSPDSFPETEHVFPHRITQPLVYFHEITSFVSFLCVIKSPQLSKHSLSKTHFCNHPARHIPK